jgi:uncharacterized protein DUF4129
MRRFAAAAVAALAAVLGASAQAPPPAPEVVLPLPEYSRSLRELAEALRSGDRDGARARARDLLACRVEARGERLAPDATVLGPIADAVLTGPAAEAEVAALAAALDEGSAGTPAAADQGRLDRLVRDDEARGLARGGVVEPGRPPTLSESVEQALEALADKVVAAWRALSEWLERFWPKPRPRQRREPSSPFATSTATVAMVAVVAAGLALLALRALRRRRGEAEPASTPALSQSSRDADPLSREAGEWERYARELAAGGRFREAVRAVYHAVLMTLFRSGRLHHQKGRTNWEYVSRLPPDAEARPGFMRLTRAFDREWYGRDRSSREAFAECADEARAILRLLEEGAAP